MGKSEGRKSIFITGAASGIGAETARHFAAKGWFIGLYDINSAGLTTMEEELGEANCISGQLDVTNREDWANAVAGFADATNGQMSVLFNNAGIGNHGWFEDITPEDSDKTVDVNIKGVINGVYAALPLLKETKDARIINTASAAGLVGSPRLAVYSATKFAVRGLSEALDVEMNELGIRVTCVMPWFVDTPILDMTDRDGSNRNMKDDIESSGASVYPVSMAAEVVWDAAHGDDVHYLVGKEAKQARLVSRLFPNFMRKRLKKDLPSRSDV